VLFSVFDAAQTDEALNPLLRGFYCFPELIHPDPDATPEIGVFLFWVRFAQSHGNHTH